MALSDLVRGDLVIVAGGTSEFGGKPRPAIVLLSPSLFGNAIPLPICPVISMTSNAPLLRIPLAAGADTGLQVPSWAAIDLVQTIRQRRIRQHIGRVARETMLAIDRVLMVFMGLT
jgi:mRNA interferase MazF